MTAPLVAIEPSICDQSRADACRLCGGRCVGEFCADCTADLAALSCAANVTAWPLLGGES